MTLLADAYLREWLDLLLRWLHVIAGMVWIGTSFYFVALDSHLRPSRAQGVAGESWEIHGGGFYTVQKYRVAPERLPEPLHWFKWEAYTTWLSGFALLVVLYYLDADTYLVDRSVADLGTSWAVAISVALLALAWILYDVLCRPAGSASASAGDRAPRLRRGGGLRRRQPLQRTRSADPARGDARDDDGRKRPLRDHPGATRARAGEAGRTGAGPGAWPSRQTALGAQQLPDAAGRALDDRPALSVPVHARAGLACPAHVDGDRGLDPSVLQPSPSGSDHLDHPGHRRSSALRTRGCDPAGGRVVSPRRRAGSIRAGRLGGRAALRDLSFGAADGRIVLDGAQGRGPRHAGARSRPRRQRSRNRRWTRRRCRSGTRRE